VPSIGLHQALGLRQADEGEHRYYDVGIEHLAVVDSRDVLDETYRRCLELGSRIHFPVQEDRDEPGYWALFVFDPDGIRLEVAYLTPEAAQRVDPASTAR
jgi:hypothetical protein